MLTDRCESQPAVACGPVRVRAGEIQESDRVTVREKGSDGKKKKRKERGPKRGKEKEGQRVREWRLCAYHEINIQGFLSKGHIGKFNDGCSSKAEDFIFFHSIQLTYSVKLVASFYHHKVCLERRNFHYFWFYSPHHKYLLISCSLGTVLKHV